MIYLNNAGTTWPKPDVVRSSVSEALVSGPETWASVYASALTTTAQFLGLDPDESRGLLFTSGCTAALSQAFTSIPWADGDRIVSSALEHHALARWLFKLAEERGVESSHSPYRSGIPLDLDFVEQELKRGGVRLIAISHASNVTGEMLPIAPLVELAREHGAMVLLDAAQTMGVLPLRPGSDGLDVDLCTFAGHKGPLSPHGIGGLYTAPRVKLRVPAAVCELPADAGDPRECQETLSFCDVGSFNLSAGAGLIAGLGYLRDQGEAPRQKGIELMRRLRAGLEQIDEVVTLGGSDVAAHTNLTSVTFQRGSVQAAGTFLRQQGIIAGAGFHCAPDAHEAIGTPRAGTLRLSTGPFSTAADIDRTLGALEEYVGTL